MREIKFRAWNGKELIYTLLYYGPGRIELCTVNFYNYKFMQFTGLLDRNGKEIYEGDIIRILLRRHMEDSVFANAQIVFEGAAFWFIAPKIGFTDCNWHFYNAEDREVIGNIYENPDLLKQ